MPRRPTMKNVESSLIARIWHNRKTKVLHIRFTTGHYYIYYNVSSYRYYKLMYAESKGRYFNKFIRGKYDYLRIE